MYKTPFKSITFILLILLQHSVAAYNLSLSKQELQQQINAKLPIKQHLMLFSVSIDSAQLALIDSSNELKLTSSLNIYLLDELISSGSTSIQGGLRYQSNEGAFYLDNARFIDFTFNNLDPHYQQDIKRISQLALSNYLAQRPIYQLDGSKVDEAMAKLMLKSVTVKQDKLEVQLHAF